MIIDRYTKDLRIRLVADGDKGAAQAIIYDEETGEQINNITKLVITFDAEEGLPTAVATFHDRGNVYELENIHTQVEAAQ